jgi:DNA mismatch repair protein MutS2
MAWSRRPRREYGSREGSTEGVQVTQVARTPSSFSPVATPETLAELEFEGALDIVAGHAVSSEGARAVCARRPVADLEAVRRELSLVASFQAALEQQVAPEPVGDLTPILATLDTPGAVLEGSALTALARNLAAIEANERTARSLESLAPALAGELASEPVPRGLRQAVERAIAPDGSVLDDASPALKRARRGVREMRARLVGALEQAMRDLPEHDRVSDGSVSVRDGRYVIPVRRDARSRIQGLVHGESSSGQTLFVEPASAVPLGNELRGLEAEAMRAELAVLRGLTESAREQRHAVEAGWRMSIRMDELYARARYAAAHRAVCPAVAPAPAPLRLCTARHPLLETDGRTAVPFDVELSGDTTTLVVSGPNAGGKTVLLKAVGLHCLLAQAGVIGPLGECSALPVFRRVFADIGDRQSIAESLSTFSAHLAALKDIVVEADRQSLVLFDELGGGTDPVEGAALAGAILELLAARGAVTIATTHLHPLKALAARERSMVNASLAFDVDTLTPTYRLVVGQPGRSYGLAIARRLGMPEEVLDSAEARLPADARALDAALAEVEQREQRMAEREAALDLLQATLERDQGRLAERESRVEAREAALVERERESERAAREQARRFLLEARRRVEEALGLARAAVSEATAREARRLVEEGVQEESEALKRLRDQAARKGWKLHGAPPAEASSRAAAREKPRAVEVESAAASSEVDLRGLRVDEAEAALASAIDAAVVAELPELRVIHGKGTGALRDVVRRATAQDSRVRRSRLAPPEQGGSGVTVVELH